MSENLLRQFDDLPDNLLNHLQITMLALAIGAAVSLPLSILVVKKSRLRYPVLTTVGVIQTIPSLALLALMVPLLVGLGALTSRLMGVEISALGFYPALIGLALYSILPMVRNTVTGILGVDASVVEAARGVGMTPKQILWSVELPLALPVIVAGTRTATVWVVGIATLATPVGQRCLGNYIFTGLQTRNTVAVLFGCIAAALLAIALDSLIGGLEKAASMRRRGLMWTATSGLLLVFVLGLIGPRLAPYFPSATALAAPQLRVESRNESSPARDQSEIRTVRVGSKTFTEQYILANLISELLREAGFEVETRESLGSTVIFDALAASEIDVYVDYSGTIWANAMNRDVVLPAWQVIAEMSAWLARERGIRSLGALGFENAYALAMRRRHAEQLGIRTIADLAEHASELKIGGDYEFFGRPEWRVMRETYGLNFRNSVSYDSTFMYSAAANAEVDVISAFSSDGRIRAYDLLVLEDPRQAIPPYDAVLLLSPRVADQDGVVEALRPLVENVDVDLMREANYRVDRDEHRQTVEQAARWLRDQLFRTGS